MLAKIGIVLPMFLTSFVLFICFMCIYVLRVLSVFFDFLWDRVFSC